MRQHSAGSLAVALRPSSGSESKNEIGRSANTAVDERSRCLAVARCGVFFSHRAFLAALYRLCLEPRSPSRASRAESHAMGIYLAPAGPRGANSEIAIGL